MSDRFAEALEAYRNALDSDPTFVDTYYNLGDAFSQPRILYGSYSVL